jgi:hypothetical protein
MKTLACAALAAIASLVACGGSVSVQPSGSGGSTSSSSTTTTTSTSTTTTSSTSSGTCPGFDNQTPIGSTTLHVVNNTGLPIYVPGQCSSVVYSITPVGGGADNVSYPGSRDCLQTCHDLQTQPPIECGVCAPSSYLIPPGSARDIPWDGGGVQSGVAMPANCWNTPGQTSCSEIVAALKGQYRVDIQGYGQCPGCSCSPDGVCNGDASGPQAYADPTMFVFPGMPQVDVVFGPCAFPCPGG